MWLSEGGGEGRRRGGGVMTVRRGYVALPRLRKPTPHHYPLSSFAPIRGRVTSNEVTNIAKSIMNLFHNRNLFVSPRTRTFLSFAFIVIVVYNQSFYPLHRAQTTTHPHHHHLFHRQHQPLNNFVFSMRP